MKKSIKPFIVVGSIIRTDMNDFWEVTALHEHTFSCRHVELIETDMEFTQEFYYNNPMIVFNESGRNVKE
jgi:hypothetical protein